MVLYSNFIKEATVKSGKTLIYTDTSKLNFEDCKICFEDDATEYYWRER